METNINHRLLKLKVIALVRELKTDLFERETMTSLRCQSEEATEVLEKIVMNIGEDKRNNNRM